MQIHRLFEIVYILLDKKMLTAKELAEQFEVSTRTIYRDLDILSSAEIPVYAEKGKGGGIALMPEYVLNKAVLTAEEKDNIRLALQCVSTVVDPAVKKSLLSKLTSSKDVGRGDIIEVDFEDWGGAIKEQFETTRAAIMKKRVLHFDYITTEGKEHRRDVEPYTLWFKDKTWYAKCYCLYSEKMLVFRLSRMRNLEISDETFEPRNEKIEHHESYLNPTTITVKAIIDGSQKYRIFDDFFEKDIVENDDGTYTVTFEKADNEYLYRNILSYGSFMKVLEPVSVKEKVKGLLEEMRGKY